MVEVEPRQDGSDNGFDPRSRVVRLRFWPNCTHRTDGTGHVQNMQTVPCRYRCLGTVSAERPDGPQGDDMTARHGANRTSRISGFHLKSPHARLDQVASFAELDPATVAHLANTGNLSPELADRMIENVIATMNVPIGIATNMKVDGEDVLVPMATEESSVVAAVCN